MRIVLAAAIALCSSCSTAPEERESVNLDYARRAGAWLGHSAVVTDDGGMLWPVDPETPESVATNLYSGSAGVVLFLLELHRYAPEPKWIDMARWGADHLAATIPERVGPEETGLYTGIAGTGFVLEEAYRLTKDPNYRAAAERCAELLHEAAIELPDGARWNDSTDVISGSAGIGFFLLYSGRRMDRPADIGLAASAGRHLLGLAEPTEAGLRWRMNPSYARVMPNFSHGTAGVATFLAALYGETGEQDFLEAAVRGARHLIAIGQTDGAECRIHHHEPGGEELFYLGWCHGPAGTARLFHELERVSGKGEWTEWRRRCARSLTTSGIPEQLTDGFWNNVGQCCGSAGVAEFLLDLAIDLDQPEFLAFARRMTGDLLARATEDERGARWVQAEHRIRPELLQAQTGYMQGAAGIGMWLLHLEAAERGRRDRIRFPDDPHSRRP